MSEFNHLINMLYLEAADMHEIGFNGWARTAILAAKALEKLSANQPVSLPPKVLIRPEDSLINSIIRKAMQTEDYYNFPADFAAKCIQDYIAQLAEQKKP